MVLIVATRICTAPNRRSPDVTTFADEQIVRLQGKAFFVRFAEVHFVKVCQSQAIPENILGAQKWPLIVSDAIPFRDLSALLDIEHGVETIHPPVRRKTSQLGLYAIPNGGQLFQSAFRRTRMSSPRCFRRCHRRIHKITALTLVPHFGHAKRVSSTGQKRRPQSFRSTLSFG